MVLRQLRETTVAQKLDVTLGPSAVIGLIKGLQVGHG
jgi:hypothetical protein